MNGGKICIFVNWRTTMNSFWLYVTFTLPFVAAYIVYKEFGPDDRLVATVLSYSIIIWAAGVAASSAKESRDRSDFYRSNCHEIKGGYICKYDDVDGPYIDAPEPEYPIDH